MFIRNKNKIWNLLHIVSAAVAGDNVTLYNGTPTPEVVHFDTPADAEGFLDKLAANKGLSIEPHIHIEAVKPPQSFGGRK